MQYLLMRKLIINSGMARNDTLTMKAGEPEKIIVILLSVILIDLICWQGSGIIITF